jgi:hypothetical protein
VSLDPKATRGYRNRNPGNIDWNERNKWQGQTGREASGNPPRFAVFSSHEFGIRALAMLLTTYQDRHGLRTLRGIIGRWAPVRENHTEAYVDAVAARTGFGPDAPLDLHRWTQLRPLVEAIIHHELGGNPYAAATIDEGLRLAGVARPVTTIADAARTGTGQGALTVGAVAAAAATAAPAVQALGALPPWVGVALVVAAAAVAVALVLAGRRQSALVS